MDKKQFYYLSEVLAKIQQLENMNLEISTKLIELNSIVSDILRMEKQ